MHCVSILCFQSDVMHLTDDSTKLKLFMDVLDGTKAAVSPPNRDTVVQYNCQSWFTFLPYLNPLFPQLTTPRSAPCLRLGSVMATLLLVLLKQWRRSERAFMFSF